MWDVFLAAVFLMLLSLPLYTIGCLLSRHGGSRAVLAAGTAIAMLTLWYALSWKGTLAVARFIPSTSAIVLGNWLPLGAALLAGILTGQATPFGWRRAFLPTALMAVAWYSVFIDLPGGPPLPSQDVWSVTKVCMQSSPSSCSPCCAVMLLRQHGIPATEREMMDLCLTSEKGTPELGLYRGLKMKTISTGWDIEMTPRSLETLMREPPTLAILLVSDFSPILGADSCVKPFAASKRAQHAVVLLAFRGDGGAIIADPACGRTEWTREMLESRWTGCGLRLSRHSL